MNRVLAFIVLVSIISIVIGTSTGYHKADAGRTEAVEVGMFLDWTLPKIDPNTSLDWKIVDAFPNLSFTNPIYVLAEPGSPDLWVAEHAGKIYRFEDRSDVEPAEQTQILDLSSRVKKDDAGGLKSFAFHPEYGQEGSPNARFIYLFYRYTPDPPDAEDLAYLRVSRFTVDNEGMIDETSEYVLIQQFSYSRWHDGGDLLFDQNGFLFISLGEDTNVAHSQTLDGGLFGGILRIDVDMDPTRSHPIRRQPSNMAGALPEGWEDSYSQGYFIPDDNPWVDEEGTYLEEFYAIGLRSPHRMTYDAVTDEIWAGDVGESRREEINLIKKKANYGWPVWEGELPGDKVGGVVLTEGTLTFPEYAYSHAEGQAIIGGHVYRGSTFTEDLDGKYLYADYVSRSVYALSPQTDTSEAKTTFLAKAPSGGLLGGIGKDSNDEPLFIRFGYYEQDNGRIYRLEKTEQEVTLPPSSLMYTAAFTDLQQLLPKEALIPYSVINPLWSDGADKQRWFAIPNNGAHDQPFEQMVFSPDSNWEFPPGSVFVKHFSYKGTHIETRFLVRGDDGEWYGLSYKWRADQTDADLLEEGLTATIEVGDDETIEWEFPGRSECFRCHTDNAGIILGFRTHQLNSESYYPTTGLTASQLGTYAALNLLGNEFDEAQLEGLLTAASLEDEEADVSLRVRSYLDSNCSHCHQPGGTAVALFDARLTTPLEEQNLINGPVVESLVDNSAVIKPGHPEQSVLYLRMNSVEEDVAMPPLARNTVDPEAIELLLEWINDPLLPVELAHFQGVLDGDRVMLNWETLSEQNNYGFDVQRRTAASDFVTIGFLEGQGTTDARNTYQFIDPNLVPGAEGVSYRLKQIDYDGQHEFSSVIHIRLNAPGQASLHDNYPDPFNPTTTIEYDVPVDGDVKMTLYDMLGRKVRTLVDAPQSAGRHRLSLDATGLPSGTYIYTLETQGVKLSKTMVLKK